MPGMLNQLQQQAKELWNDMDKSQKTRMIFIAILVLVSVSLAMFIVTRPNYERLFSGRIDAKEIGEMSKILNDNRIEHKIGDGESSIEVKAKDKDAAQRVLTQSGYPKGGMTFNDALSSIKLSTTESDKKKIFKEYDEQKIAGGIKKIDGIMDAVVNLSLPEKEFFLDDKNEQMPSAAVLVEARGELSKKQVDGIARFVAASVEGLDVKNVKVIDKATGNMLNDTDDEDFAVSTTKQYEYQLSIKKETENKVKELLGNMYDGVKVGANIICDFNTESTKEVKYTPVVGDDSGILKSSQTSKEEVQNGSSGGVPGTDSNGVNSGTPSYTSESSGSSYKRTETNNSFEVNQKNTESTKAIGQMDKDKSSITVSLLYGGVKAPNAPVLTDIDTYKKMIATATGITEKNITIASFKLPAIKAETQKTDWIGLIKQITPFAVLGILTLLLAIGIMKKSGSREGNLAFNVPTNKPNFSINKGEDELLPEIEFEEKSEVKKQIDKFVKHKPDAVAQLLRNWLADEWN